uniref:Tudor and KH domain containing n=1 Tax=Varanus komodoensis TaxID=61221 RepID=A0A8D2IXP1_VARKO
MASERSSWNSLTTLQKVALGLGIPASGAILYILYRRYRESQEEQLTFVGEEEIEVEMKVPKEAMKILIGRHGTIIKQLRKDSCARIDIDVDDSGEEQLVRIGGSPVQVCKAKAAIHQILAESLPVKEKIHVPQRAVGRIIGRGGETVRAICRSTGAKVDCDRAGDSSLALTRLITLSGTRKEVEAAKQLILEKLSEDEAFRKKLSQSAQVRTPRKQPLGVRKEEAAGDQGGPPHRWRELSSLSGPEAEARGMPEDSPDEPQVLRSQDVSPEDSLSGASCPIPSPDFSFLANEHLEVYVSASENPNHFWVQIIGSRALQLDKLTREMTQYYENAELPDVHIGDIVAARYPDDNSWYRARVLGPLGNGNLDLYYVDFGDNGEAPLEKLQPLRYGPGRCPRAWLQWEEAALDEFDRLTHCAKWKPVVAKISSYVPSGSSTWPHIRLYNTTEGQVCAVGFFLGRILSFKNAYWRELLLACLQLVRLGYAVRCLPDDEGATGDGPHHLDKGAASSTPHKNLVSNSSESLLPESECTGFKGL